MFIVIVDKKNIFAFKVRLRARFQRQILRCDLNALTSKFTAKSSAVFKTRLDKGVRYLTGDYQYVVNAEFLTLLCGTAW